MRRAFIGLSTPIGFDYANYASKAPADEVSSPNPVLDSPFGLLLLYDELVFLTRSLCPQNMRALPYVRFLDEESKLPQLTAAEVDEAALQGWDEDFEQQLLTRPYGEVIDAIGLPADLNVDNHSHGLSIGAIKRQANPSLDNMAIDLLVHHRLNDPMLEFIANSRFQPAIEGASVSPGHPRLAELIAIEGIPNYLSKSGPYHKVIEEVRGNQYLSDFRQWISSKPRAPSIAEIAEMKRDVEHALREAQESSFLKHLEPKRHFETVGRAMLSDALNFLMPAGNTIGAVVGSIVAIGESVVVTANEKSQYWQGFLTSTRRATRSTVSR